MNYCLYGQQKKLTQDDKTPLSFRNFVVVHKSKEKSRKLGYNIPHIQIP